jgi:hypothetical protein
MFPAVFLMIITFNGLVLCQYVPCNSAANCHHTGSVHPFYAQVFIPFCFAALSIVCDKLSCCHPPYGCGCHQMFVMFKTQHSTARHSTLQHDTSPVCAQTAVVALAMAGLVLFNFIAPWCVRQPWPALSPVAAQAAGPMSHAKACTLKPARPGMHVFSSLPTRSGSDATALCMLQVLIRRRAGAAGCRLSGAD